MITDYSLLFIDDYSPIKDLVDSIFVHRWERAYSRGILEKRLENYDLVLLDLDTGNQLQRDTIDEIHSTLALTVTSTSAFFGSLVEKRVCRVTIPVTGIIIGL